MWLLRPDTSFLPSIAYDSGQNMININRDYSTNPDLYKNNVVMVMNQIPGGTTTIGPPTNITTSYDSTTGDGTVFGFFSSLGDYMSLAAHGGTGTGSSRVYLGFTNNARQGTYGGITNTQADNNVSRATY